MPPSPTHSCFLEKNDRQPRPADGAGLAPPASASAPIACAASSISASPCSSQSSRSAAEVGRVAAEVHRDHGARARGDAALDVGDGRGSGRSGRLDVAEHAAARRCSAARWRWRRTSAPARSPRRRARGRARGRRGAAPRCRSTRPTACGAPVHSASAASNSLRARAHRQPAACAGTRAPPRRRSSVITTSVSGIVQLMRERLARARRPRGPASPSVMWANSGIVISVRATRSVCGSD